MRHLIIVMALTLLSSWPAHAAFKSGNDLLEYCEKEKGSFDRGVCGGYIIGVVDNSGTQICLPDGVIVGQLQDVVVQFLKNNPNSRHYTGSSIVALSLKKAFPCKN